MKITFTQQYTVKAAGGETYKEGQTVDLPDGSASHFIRRGVAEKAASKPVTAKGPKKD